MPTMKATVTAPTFEAVITKPCLTIDLPERHMRVQVEDNGHVRVVQQAYDLLDGAPSTPRNENFPRYVQGGEYSFILPALEYVAEHCDAKDDVYNDGKVMIPFEHRH